MLLLLLLLILRKGLLTVAAAAAATSIIVLLMWAKKARSYRRMDGDRLEGWHRSGRGCLGGSSNSFLLDIEVVSNTNTFDHVCSEAESKRDGSSFFYFMTMYSTERIVE